LSVIEKAESYVPDTTTQPGETDHYEVGVVDGAVSAESLLALVKAHLPTIRFHAVARDAGPTVLTALDAVILPGDLGARLDELLKGTAGAVKTLVVLEDTSISASRRLFSLGATDILPAPLTESSLILSLERLIRAAPPAASKSRSEGSVVAMLKAGGGVGATFLATQTAAHLARRNEGLVCMADLDIQFGTVAEYLDGGQSVTATDVIANPAAFSDTTLATALLEHASGCRIMGAPKDVAPLESLTISHVETVISSLRRTFATTLVDLPSVWTQWSYRALQMSDRIVLVTNLSVPHIQIIKRQMRLLTAQKLDDKPLVLVLNAVTADQLSALPVKVAEKAIGRSFDLVIADDARTANLAVNQGVEIQDIKRGTKIAGSIAQLASLAVSGTPATAASGGFNLKFW